MDFKSRRSALVTQLQQLRQAINEAAVRAAHFEGAIAFCDEVIKEQDGVDSTGSPELGPVSTEPPG